MKNIDSDLIRGNIDTIILTTMLDGDKYGLDIIKEVEIRSNGTYELKQPTLYSCLKRLENQELISSYWLDSDIGGRRHYYKLTEKGKASLLQKQEEWTKSKFIIDNLLSNHDYDEYRLVKKEDYEKIIEGKQFEYKPENSPVSATPVEEQEGPEVEDVEDRLEETDIEENDDFEVENQDDNDETYVLSEDISENEKRIDYNDDSDDAEADYPNQKRFKIPSIYDKINIDDSNDENDEFQEDDVEDENDNEYVSSVYSEYDEDDDVQDDESEDYGDDLNYNPYESEDEDDSEFENDEFMLGDEETEEDDGDDRVYISSYKQDEDDDDDLDIKVSPISDQSQNEMNILSRLRMQNDEEINEYVGNKNSYINHLNQHEEIEKLRSDDLDVVQENLLYSDYLSQQSIDAKISDFSKALENLNNFDSTSFDEDEDNEPLVSDEDIENFETEIEEELITTSNEHEDSENVIDFKEDKVEDAEDFDSYLSELDELKEKRNNGFFNSLDSAEYLQNEYSSPEISSPFNGVRTFNSLEDFDDNDSSDAAFEKQVEDYNNQYGYNQPTSQNDFDEDEDTFSKTIQDDEIETDFVSFDDIISKNVNDYTEDTTKFMSSEQFQSFVPRYTENNYKQKLNNLSAYSKINAEKESEEPVSNEEVMNKVKDIQTLRAEFEDEGICVKEYKKSHGNNEVDRTYLMVNKLNLIKSLILLFGYVFVLSAVYIIMNNTSARDIHNFSFKYFLYGFIPFGIYALYHTVMFVISPYKKVPAKFAPRIMIFISVIITIQLLLITYCVNLQLGFYSFSQNYYNHLIWVIPTVISFAPIISNLIHMALYYSRNFHV